MMYYRYMTYYVIYLSAYSLNVKIIIYWSLNLEYWFYTFLVVYLPGSTLLLKRIKNLKNCILLDQIKICYSNLTNRSIFFDSKPVMRSIWNRFSNTCNSLWDTKIIMNRPVVTRRVIFKKKTSSSSSSFIVEAKKLKRVKYRRNNNNYCSFCIIYTYILCVFHDLDIECTT